MSIDLYDESILKFALGWSRMAAEEFVGTHPSLIPCSFSKGQAWSVDPPGSFSSHVITWTGNPKLEEMLQGMNHLKEWYLLPGILWRYHVLYGEMPPSESWVWRHYPDGNNWKEAVERLGFPEAFYYRTETEAMAMTNE